MRRAAWLAPAVLVLSLTPARADVADFLDKPIASVKLEVEGTETTDPKLLEIVETRAGSLLSMVAVRETVTRLFSLGRYEDVRVDATPASGGVNLTYDLVPLHPIEKIEFRGTGGHAGIDEGRLMRDVVGRYGASPPVARANDLARIVEDDLHEEGYLHPTVTPQVDIRHRPDVATLAFVVVEPGVRTSIGQIDIVGNPGLSRKAFLDALDIAPDEPYQSDVLDARITRFIDDRRSKGYLEASLVPSTDVAPDGRLVKLTLTVDQGPIVRVAFKGDPLPEDMRKDLVPIEREGSADEDLLEDSSNRIEDYLRTQGYRDASAPHAREENNGELLITFTVKKGSRYLVDHVEVTGIETMSLAEIEPAVRIKPADAFSEAKLDADIAAILDLYRRQGFSAARVQGDVEPLPGPAPRAVIPVVLRIAIVENVRTIVKSVRFEGNTAVPDAQLRRDVDLQPGRPYSAASVLRDRDAIQARYANLGFQNTSVGSTTNVSDEGRSVDVTFTVSEGPQLLIDHILIVGNVRTKSAVIERELQFKSGDPLGAGVVADTQRRLTALGLFRRLDITALGHSQNTRDVLITLDEAPVTTISYGVGVEAAELSLLSESGVAEQQLEFAPRAFAQIARTNLFGKNRSVSLFTRLSLLPKDSPVFAGQTVITNESQFGFPEYRVLATYREPRVFGTAADAFLNGTLEQQVRSSFDFSRRAFSAEAGRRISRRVSVSGNYQIQRIELFNEQIVPGDQLLIDRLFPQVRLSSFSASIIRDTRDDSLDPTEGTYVSVYGQVAARAIGSEVGLAKQYLAAERFQTLPNAHRTVLATRLVLGTAVGFPREVAVAAPDGSSTLQTVTELPASERFFAGGDTTVRGFALDSLGAVNTLDQNSGLALGGNALLILNTELRLPFRSLQFVGFFDTGQVFAQLSDIDLGKMRSSIGFGVRYKSPVGPIRVDLGFKVHRHEIVPGKPEDGLESLTALHISLGQAF